MSRKPLSVLACLLACVFTTSTYAQSDLLSRMAGQGAGTLDAERLRPGLDDNAILDVESGRLQEPGDLSWSFWLGYNRAPVRALWTNDGKTTSFDIVGQRIGANLIASLGINEWLQLGVDLPFAFLQSGSTVLPGVEGTNPVGVLAGLGDLRLSPKIALMNTDAGDMLDMAVVLHTTLPTSFPRHHYIGDGLPTLAAELALSRDYGALRWAANIGPRLRFPSTFVGVVQGQELGYRLGVGYDLEETLGMPLAVDLSANGAATLAPAFLPPQSNPVEALVGVTTELGGLDYFVAAGAGIPGSGAGAPQFRALGGVRYAPSCADPDADGICSQDDGCPDAAEDVDDFMDSDGCPDLDNDEDGVLDTADKCPDSKEDADGFEDDDGCEDADNDADGVLDGADKCPLEAGAADNNGCPVLDADKDGIVDGEDRCPEQAGVPQFKGCADSDNDGLADPDDKCPNEPETQNGFEDEDGCADTPPPVLNKVKVKQGKIDLDGKVMFESGISTLASSSYALLDEVVTLLQANPKIRKVRIEGHTDSSGADAVNMTLSGARARSVKAYLVKKGVSADRLVAKGFGETQPIADNRTAEGREQNRRVVFVIEDAAQ